MEHWVILLIMWHQLLALAGQHGIIANTLTVFSVLLGLAVVIAVLTKLIRIPYTIALVLAGPLRDLLLPVAFGVVSISLLLQGLTSSVLLSSVPMSEEDQPIVDAKA